MVKEKPYKASSLSGAQSSGPAFWNPLEAFAAQERRDEILRRWCRLKAPRGRMGESPVDRGITAKS